MAVQRLTLTAGQTFSASIAIPMAYQGWTGMGISCLVNFSGQGGASGAGGTAAVGTVTLQASSDPSAGPSNPLTQQATARWNNHDILVNLTADKNDSIVYPLPFVRLVGTVSSGTVTCDIGWADNSNPAAY